MSRTTVNLSDDLCHYLVDHAVRETAVQQALRAETATLPDAPMQISPEQGALMALLVRLLGAQKTLEVGVYTGYSALAVALALPPGGKIIACDISEAYTAVAQRYWRDAGMAHKIALHLAPAAQTLRSLRDGGEAGEIDFAFIDADKENIAVYFEHCLALLRPGGLIAVDNVLWGGAVIDPRRQDASTVAIRAFNTALAVDERVDMAMVPIGDGLTLARKR